MSDCRPVAYSTWPLFSLVLSQVVIWIGVPAAVACACLYGLPWHAVVLFLVLVHVTGLATTVGLHRLFSHRAFQTSRPVEWALMILGAMTGQSSPFFWVAIHRLHHRVSDLPGDPHSPHLDSPKGWWRRFWHAHHGWTVDWAGYDPATVRDLAKRPDLSWIDRHWYAWYLLGQAIPAALGYLIGGTPYDALMGFLWGGLLRHAVNLQGSYLVNSVGHLWGAREYATGDQSRNNLMLGLLTFGEGWHNNHHAHPYSARHGFRWWQPDLSWNVIWLMERVGLVWNVKRPKLDARKQPHPEVAEPEGTPATAASES